MANMIKYGRYWIAAGIAVGGVLWFNRPGDPRIMGEDIAATFEAVQDLNVAYMTGTELPDWPGWNADSTNSIYAPIQYAPILSMANRLREKVAKSSGSIFWTQAEFGDTVQLCFSQGGYSITNSTGATLEDGTVITNAYYSYSTNIFLDSIVTTSTRVYTNGSNFHYTMPIEGGYQIISKTNAPLSSIVYNRGAAIGCTNTAFQTTGSWWPFAWSYSFPWEQWSYPQRSRVIFSETASSNIKFPAAWISTNSLSFTFEASSTDTNIASFAIGNFCDIAGNKSVSMAYVSRAPTNAIYLYIPGGSSGYSTDIARNITWSDSWSSSLAVRKTGLADGQEISASVIGNPLTVSIVAESTGAKLFSISAASIDKTNTLSVIKFSVPSQTNISPIYVAFSVCNGTPVKTNGFFSVVTYLVTDQNPQGTATTNAITASFIATDDRRITTNKLNDLARVVTNLYRTIYIGSVDAITATNRRTITHSLDGATYVSESLSGSGSTISYYDSYDLPTILADAQVTDTVTTNDSAAAYTPDVFCDYSFYLQLLKWGYVSSVPAWSSFVTVSANTHEIDNFSYQGCTLSYPSAWAVTNGYISKVTVYGAFEAKRLTTQPYIGWPSLSSYGTFTEHSVSGEYWHEGNHGITIADKVLNVPSHAVDADRTKGLQKEFVIADTGNFNFTDTAIFSKLWETNNPTEIISFDLDTPSITHGDPAARFAGFDWTGTNTALEAYAEGFSETYSLGYRVEIKRILIVVDWKFQHLGRGFEPQTNSPSWR